MATTREEPQRSTTAKTAERRPSIREEQKQRTRERLLDAAFEVFSEVGFRAATVDEIMRRAGANRATFYLHFTDKIDVAAALGRRKGRVVAERFRVLDQLVNPTRDDVRRWVESEMVARRQDKVLNQVVQEACTTDPGFGQEYVDYHLRVAARVMVRTVARWPEALRPLARAKVVNMLTLLDRVSFMRECQDLQFGDCDPVEALVDTLWNELYRPCQPTGRARAAA